MKIVSWATRDLYRCMARNAVDGTPSPTSVFEASLSGFNMFRMAECLFT